MSETAIFHLASFKEGICFLVHTYSTRPLMSPVFSTFPNSSVPEYITHEPGAGPAGVCGSKRSFPTGTSALSWIWNWTYVVHVCYIPSYMSTYIPQYFTHTFSVLIIHASSNRISVCVCVMALGHVGWNRGVGGERGVLKLMRETHSPHIHISLYYSHTQPYTDTTHTHRHRK